MILLDTTYVSPLLAETIIKKEIKVCDIHRHEILGGQSNGQQGLVNVFEHEELLIMNAEEAFNILNEYHAESHVTKMANLFKNKIAFRKRLAESYPNFFYLETSISGLSNVDMEALAYPIILKPSVGYSSVGVYRIGNVTEFNSVVNELGKTMQQLSGKYTKDVLDSESFIIESYIEGQEFAVDLYFDKNNEPVVLNVFARMFKDEKDMSDRIYYTSKQVLQNYLASITDYLKQLGNIFELQRMPLHVELRIDERGVIVPIEVNPLRFAGAGTTELGDFAYGVNPYGYFFEQRKPNWSQLIDAMDDKIYSFTCAEFDTDIKIDDRYIVRHDLLKEQFPHILEYRHIPYESGSTFAVIFYSSDSLEQNEHILSLDFMEFVEKKETILTEE